MGINLAVRLSQNRGHVRHAYTYARLHTLAAGACSFMASAAEAIKASVAALICATIAVASASAFEIRAAAAASAAAAAAAASGSASALIELT